MTLPEIRSLRAELEVALKQAFQDFERLTGASILRIDVAHVVYANICDRPEKRIREVTVELEI